MITKLFRSVIAQRNRFFIGRWALVSALLVILLGLAPIAPSFAATSYSNRLTRYPYLTDISSSTVTINFATSRAAGSSASAKYGTVASGGACTPATLVAADPSINFTVQNADLTTTPESQWKVKLSGLQPETKYCYRIFFNPGTGDQDLLGSDSSPVFQTIPVAGVNRPLKFIVFGDWGEVDAATGANPDMQEIIRLMSQQGAQFALTVGDNIYNTTGLSVPAQTVYGDLYHQEPGKSAVFGPNFWKVAGSTLPLFPSLGNHIISAVDTSLNHPDLMNWPQDRAVSGSNGISAVTFYPSVNGSNATNYPTLYYAFSSGLARFYVLDAAWGNSNSTPTAGTGTDYQNEYDSHWTAGSAEYQWLLNDLQTHNDPIKFAIFHYPMYSDGPEKSDTYLQGTSSLEGLLTQYGVQFGFSGHSHIYERNTTKNGMTTYITGGGGSELVPVGPCSSYDLFGIGWSYKSGGSKCGSATAPTDIRQVFHFLLITVDGKTVTITPINELGNKFDEQVYNLNITIPTQKFIYLPFTMR